MGLGFLKARAVKAADERQIAAETKASPPEAAVSAFRRMSAVELAPPAVANLAGKTDAPAETAFKRVSLDAAAAEGQAEHAGLTPAQLSVSNEAKPDAGELLNLISALSVRVSVLEQQVLDIKTALSEFADTL